MYPCEHQYSTGNHFSRVPVDETSSVKTLLCLLYDILMFPPEQFPPTAVVFHYCIFIMCVCVCVYNESYIVWVVTVVKADGWMQLWVDGSNKHLPLCICVCVYKCVSVCSRGHSALLQFVRVVHVFVRSTCMCPAVLLYALNNMYNTHTHAAFLSLWPSSLSHWSPFGKIFILFCRSSKPWL